MFAVGALFGTAGITLLGSRDARRVYAQTAAAALVRLPFDMSDPEQRGKVLSLRNTFTCEAHKEVVDTCLRLAETGRLDEAAAGYARLEALQDPDFFGDRDADGFTL